MEEGAAEVEYGSAIACNQVQGMLCIKPYQKGVQTFGCGQCMPCRINHKRLWTGRMLLEAMEHPYSAFVTLTYNEENLPKDLCVNKRHIQLFLKRIRKETAPRRIRYYAVGEYGENYKRPHYHLILFGISPTENLLLERCWTSGFVHIGTVEPASITYTLGYVAKKSLNKTDEALRGRVPEFALMSKVPGLGSGAVNRIGTAYETEAGRAALLSNGWIGHALQVGGRQYPLGRYLKTKLATRLSLGDRERTARNWRHIQEVFDRNKGKSLREIKLAYRTQQQQQAIPLKRKATL